MISLTLPMEQKKGKVFIFSAPSGAGKTTIVKRVLAIHSDFEFSVSATTRSPRPHEQDGIDYYFLKEEEFVERIDQEAFLEWEEVYKGRFYGSLKHDVERIRQKGHHVAFDVDVKGGINIKKFYRDDAISIFIQPPNLPTLKKRLEFRGTESKEEIDRRYKKAAKEMEFAKAFDYIIVNDDLEVAVGEVLALIQTHLTKVS